MIISFAHKGLENFYYKNSLKGINATHAKKLRRILNMLDTITDLDDIDEPYQLHLLKGDLKGFHSVKVSGAWRVIFKFTDKGIELIDYLNYH